MTTDPPGLHPILQEIDALFQEFTETSHPMKRLAMLKQIRLLLSDADKIISSEIGAYPTTHS